MHLIPLKLEFYKTIKDVNWIPNILEVKLIPSLNSLIILLVGLSYIIKNLWIKKGKDLKGLLLLFIINKHDIISLIIITKKKKKKCLDYWSKKWSITPFDWIRF